MDNLVQRKQLIRYLPDFMKQFGEFQEIMKVEDLQFDRMDVKMQSILNNAFIEDADEYGIQKYETLLGFVPSVNDTLELRKSRVLLHWNNRTPYTYRVLILKLNSLCGVNNYNISGSQENYHLHFETHLSLFGQVKELEILLEKILPENMYYESSNMLECRLEGAMNLGGNSCLVSTVEVTNDYIADYSILGSASVGGGLSTHTKIQLTNDFNEETQTNSDVSIASGIVQVGFFEIN